MHFETLAVSESEHIAHIHLNRPDKANAFNKLMWQELKTAFEWVDGSSARVAILSGSGRHFSSGIDIELLLQIQSEIAAAPESLRHSKLNQTIQGMQDAVNTAEHCRKPILAAIHGACIGGAVDLVAACDMRYATVDAKFSVKEVDLAIIADLGTLQRLPHLIGDGLTRELAYTGKEFDGLTAHAIGLVNQTYADQSLMMESVQKIATRIVSKSPKTIRGIKEVLNFSRDHSVAEGLSYVADKNSRSLMSDDLVEAISAKMQKRPPKFKD